MIYRISTFFWISLFFPGFVFALEATYYADSFEGGGTSDGTRFSQSVFSAAACDVELGQYGYVQYGNTGTVVTVNDRPNCRKHPDVVDLSRSAFETLAPTSVGRIKEVSLSLLGKNVNSFPKKDLTADTFANLGIRLKNNIANTYFADDTILIQGKVTIKKEYALIYLEEKSTSKKVVTELTKTDKNGNFSYLLHFPKQEGDYYLIIAGGNSFETTNPPLIKLIKRENLQYPDISSTRYVFRPVVSTGENPIMNLPTNIWASLSIIRDGQVFTTQGIGALSFQGINFTPGKAQIWLEGYSLSTPSSLDRNRYIPSLFSGSVILNRAHEDIGRNKVSIRVVRNIATFRFQLPKDIQVDPVYYVTLPNGDVRRYDIRKEYIDTSGFLKTQSWISGNFPTPDEGAYKFELVQSDGFAYANFAIYRGNVWGVLSTITNDDKIKVRTNKAQVETDTLTAINALRAGLGRNLVATDPTLMKIAQAKAEDMIVTGVSHQNSQGKDIRSLMRFLDISYNGVIYENVAGGNVSDMSLQDGLEESGSHRAAMIAPEVTKVGIGYAVKDGKTYMAQVFGE